MHRGSLRGTGHCANYVDVSWRPSWICGLYFANGLPKRSPTHSYDEGAPSRLWHEGAQLVA